jgi:hypothetical protein
MRRSRLAVTAAGMVLTLAGCGNVSPGAAATVNGEAIPLAEVDSMARAFCAADIAAAALQDQEPEPRGTADYRYRVLSTLVNAEVADDLASERGIDVPPASYEQNLSEYEALFAEMPDTDVDALLDYIASFSRLQATTEALGAERAGADADPSAALAAGQRLLQREVQNADIDLDPRFGELTGGQVVGGSGSLSVPAVGGDEPAEAEGDTRPATQTCSA